MTHPWKAIRQWKGKECLIELDISGAIANLWKMPAAGVPFFTVIDPAAAVVQPLNAELVVHTDPRFAVGNPPHYMRYMREGVMSGLEGDPEALPGRFIICKAIGLAVHLGASRIRLDGMLGCSPRARRNLETMVRPLKGRRVYVYEPDGALGLFPKE